MEQIPEFRMLWNAKNNTEYVFLSIFYPIFAFPDRNFSCENEIKGKKCNSGPICQNRVYMNFPGHGKFAFFK